MKKVLVISPHPDDESIGCGGTLRKHIIEGDLVEVIFLTSGEKGGHGKPEEETVKTRENESVAAAGILEISKIEFWREPDGAFKATDANVQRLVEKMQAFRPDVLYVPHQDEDHPDHREAAILVNKAVSLIHCMIAKPNVWMYEVWTPIQHFDHIVDISPYVAIKRTAIRAHKSQCEVLDFEEAILGLNRYRGEMFSWPEGDYAEIFQKLV